MVHQWIPCPSRSWKPMVTYSICQITLLKLNAGLTIVEMWKSVSWNVSTTCFPEIIFYFRFLSYLNSFVVDVTKFHVSLNNLLVQDVLAQLLQPVLDSLCVWQHLVDFSVHVWLNLHLHIVLSWNTTLHNKGTIFSPESWTLAKDQYVGKLLLSFS